MLAVAYGSTKMPLTIVSYGGKTIRCQSFTLGSLLVVMSRGAQVFGLSEHIPRNVSRARCQATALTIHSFCRASISFCALVVAQPDNKTDNQKELEFNGHLDVSHSLIIGAPGEGRQSFSVTGNTAESTCSLQLPSLKSSDAALSDLQYNFFPEKTIFHCLL